MPFLGIALGILAPLMFLWTKSGRGLALGSCLAGGCFVLLWIVTEPRVCYATTEAGLQMCRSEHSLWQGVRLVFIGFPGAIVAILWTFKLLARIAQAGSEPRRPA